MTATLDDDIIEYSQSLERLQTENMALKLRLRRHMAFDTPGRFSNLSDCDLSRQLSEVEQLFNVMFASLQVPAFAGEVIYNDWGLPQDFVYTKVNQQFADYYHLEARDIIGKAHNSISILKSKFWMDCIATSTKTLDTVQMNIMEGDDNINVSVSSVRHDTFVAHFVSGNMSRERNQKVLENLRFTQMMIDAIPTPLFYKDMEGRYILCNMSYAKSIVGVSPETIIGKTAQQLENIFPKEYADFYQEKDIQLIKEKGIQTYEGPIKCSDGEVREYIINKTLIKDDQGNFIGILGVMQDIDGLLATKRELAESESRYKNLFNGIKQPIIVVDKDGNVIMLNTTAIELFMEDEEMLMDPTAQDVPAQQLINMEMVRHVYETEQPTSHRVSITSQGKERHYMSTMQCINDFFGEKVVQIISNDITEIKRYQTELLEEKQRAEESNNLKTVFLSNIAHETRTPANIISGLVQLIQSGLHKDRHPEYLKSIYANCQKLLDIIDDIVQLSQIETGQIKIRHEICSINNIVEEAFVYLSDMHQDSGKQLQLLCTDPINEYESLVYADSQYISQALRKLISNAVTFTNQGSIKVGARIEGQNVSFFVKDTGIGIPQEKLSVIFERFRQGDEGASRKYGGNGLGLSIVNELVVCMGGTISVESRENEGSTFSFTIPYTRAGR